MGFLPVYVKEDFLCFLRLQGPLKDTVCVVRVLQSVLCSSFGGLRLEYGNPLLSIKFSWLIKEKKRIDKEQYLVNFANFNFSCLVFLRFCSLLYGHLCPTKQVKIETNQGLE